MALVANSTVRDSSSPFGSEEESKNVSMVPEGGADRDPRSINIDRYYSPIQELGHGAYGIVVSALNNSTQEKVAVKKIFTAYGNTRDATRTFREMVLMKHLQHDNIVRLLDVITDGEDAYLVYEYMEADLNKIIRSQQPLSNTHWQFFIYQILRGLKYIHSANVLHRDLKPSNLLVNTNCDLKICDFNLARSGPSDKGLMTEYVVTRWYRAPELLLSCNSYSAAIDVWSVGCIFAEIIARRPLFPGRDYKDQLARIIGVLGPPRDEDLEFITNPMARRFMEYLRNQSLQNQPLEVLLPQAQNEQSALDLLSKMLMFDPSRRIGVDEALNHPYLSHLHDEIEEPVANFDMEDVFAGEEGLRKVQIRERFFMEMMSYHPEIADEVREMVWMVNDVCDVFIASNGHIDHLV